MLDIVSFWVLYSIDVISDYLTMDKAKAIYLGGTSIFPDKIGNDYDAYKKLGLVCFECGEEIHLRNGNIRKSYFAHFQYIGNNCSLRTQGSNSFKNNKHIEFKNQSRKASQEYFLQIVAATYDKLFIVLNQTSIDSEFQDLLLTVCDVFRNSKSILTRSDISNVVKEVIQYLSRQHTADLLEKIIHLTHLEYELKSNCDIKEVINKVINLLSGITNWSVENNKIDHTLLFTQEKKQKSLNRLIDQRNIKSTLEPLTLWVDLFKQTNGEDKLTTIRFIVFSDIGINGHILDSEVYVAANFDANKSKPLFKVSLSDTFEITRTSDSTVSNKLKGTYYSLDHNKKCHNNLDIFKLAFYRWVAHPVVNQSDCKFWHYDECFKIWAYLYPLMEKFWDETEAYTKLDFKEACELLASMDVSDKRLLAIKSIANNALTHFNKLEQQNTTTNNEENDTETDNQPKQTNNHFSSLCTSSEKTKVNNNQKNNIISKDYNKQYLLINGSKFDRFLIDDNNQVYVNDLFFKYLDILKDCLYNFLGSTRLKNIPWQLDDYAAYEYIEVVTELCPETVGTKRRQMEGQIPFDLLDPDFTHDKLLSITAYRYNDYGNLIKIRILSETESLTKLNQHIVDKILADKIAKATTDVNLDRVYIFDKNLIVENCKILSTIYKDLITQEWSINRQYRTKPKSLKSHLNLTFQVEKTGNVFMIVKDHNGYQLSKTLIAKLQMLAITNYRWVDRYIGVDIAEMLNKSVNMEFQYSNEHGFKILNSDTSLKQQYDLNGLLHTKINTDKSKIKPYSAYTGTYNAGSDQETYKLSQYLDHISEYVLPPSNYMFSIVDDKFVAVDLNNANDVILLAEKLHNGHDKKLSIISHTLPVHIAGEH